MRYGVYLILLTVGLLPAQRKMQPRDMYNRIIAVVPMQGKGTEIDPFRPMYAPSPHKPGDPPSAGITGYSYQMSDDGKLALVEFVARDRSAFSAILSNPQVKAFDRKGKKD